MSLVINNNSIANLAANDLSSNYSQLARSTQRLSSGLRINSAADDASGLAVRELMRSDITALRQGMRNTNDAISMLQTADGALAIIDEKLIRMKELAEQASTGTYTSTQRAIIDSEFQQMASEIERIAQSTDFNGIKILSGDFDRSSSASDDDYSYDGSSATASRSSGGSIDLDVDSILATIKDQLPEGTTTITLNDKHSGLTTTSGKTVTLSGDLSIIRGQTVTLTYDQLSSGRRIWDITSPSGYSVLNGNSTDSVAVINNGGGQQATITFSTPFSIGETDTVVIDSDYPADNEVLYYLNGNRSTTVSGSISNRVLTLGPVAAGSTTITPTVSGVTSATDISQIKYVFKKTKKSDQDTSIPDDVVKIHFGSGNDSAEDYYYVDKSNATLEGLKLNGVSISTQDSAQAALKKIDDAIVIKDKIRAYYGTMQNRFENTLTNITIQSENLQAAESRISDADVAEEMMHFVKRQILTQSSLAMLAQANNLPQMALRLIS